MTQFFAYRENMTTSLSGQFGKMLNYLTYSNQPSNETIKKESLIRRQHVMEALDDSIREEQQQTLAPPNCVLPQHSLLFETTTRKLYKHRTSLGKQVLLKQLYGKLQTTKRHGIIMLSSPEPPPPPPPQQQQQQQPKPMPPPRKIISTPPPSLELAYLHNAGHQKYYQRRMMPNQGLLFQPTPIQRKRASPPSPISPPYSPKSICNGDDDDNIPLGALLPTQQLQFQQKQLHRIGVCVI